MLLRQDRDTASLSPSGRPAPGLGTEQAFHRLSQSWIALRLEPLLAAPATGGRVWLDLLLAPPRCRKKGFLAKPSTGLPLGGHRIDYMAGLNRSHQQQHGPFGSSEDRAVNWCGPHATAQWGHMYLQPSNRPYMEDSRAPEGVFLAGTVARSHITQRSGGGRMYEVPQAANGVAVWLLDSWPAI